MKLLLENWRQYLNEGTNTIADLPEGAYVEIDNSDNTDIEVNLFFGVGPSGMRKLGGHIQMYLIDADFDEGCTSGVYETHAEAESGWGPFVYDIAIEYATMIGRGATSSRRGSSQDAQNVWQHYYDKRGDVEQHQMDDIKNTLTQTDDDNCVQTQKGTAGWSRTFINTQTPSRGDWSPRSGTNPKSGEDVKYWTDRSRHLRNSAFSRYYSKAPTTIEKLQQLGKIEIRKDDLIVWSR